MEKEPPISELRYRSAYGLPKLEPHGMRNFLLRTLIDHIVVPKEFERKLHPSVVEHNLERWTEGLKELLRKSANLGYDPEALISVAHEVILNQEAKRDRKG